MCSKGVVLGQKTVSFSPTIRFFHTFTCPFLLRRQKKRRWEGETVRIDPIFSSETLPFQSSFAVHFFCAAKRNEPKKRQFKGEKDARNGDTHFSPLKIPLSPEEGRRKENKLWRKTLPPIFTPFFSLKSPFLWFVSFGDAKEMNTKSG
ncbi:MAG: hypothetical protein KHZ93_03915 [Clostridiales bacterium]|nr:hypothetical protein [Clostridiales bacterium]